MSIKVFSDVIDVAIIGLTNSGKSTFITSMIDRMKFGEPELLDKLHQNNGGLTKVTSLYALKDCEEAKVTDVCFDLDLIINDIATNNIDKMNERLSGKIYKEFQITPIVSSEDGTFASSLDSSLNEFSNKLKSDLKYAISIINKPNADKLLKNIKIQVPATNRVIEMMRKYEFSTVVLRDTRGFLDANLDEMKKKAPTLGDNGLDGIQSCILMNGQDSPMPNIGRELYGDFVKSIFEAVPTFIIERSGKLAGKLEDIIDKGAPISSDVYSELVNNPKVAGLNFNEVHKFLNSLGIIDENGNSTNQLIEANKRELLLPEVRVLKSEVIEYTSDEYKMYDFCAMEVFEHLLSTLSNFRTLLNKITLFFDDPIKIKDVQAQFFSSFYNSLFAKIVKEYYDYDRNCNIYVRPITEGYNSTNLLGDLMNGDLLGPRGGITTRNGHYRYGATGVFAVTSKMAMNTIIIDLKKYNGIVSSIKNYVDDPKNTDIFDTYVLEIQQCLKYVLQNSFTDVWSNFSGYSIVDRNKIIVAINKVRDLWNKTYAQNYGNNAINTVYIKSIALFIQNNLPSYTVDCPKVSQLYQCFYNVIDEFFDCVSNNHDYTADNNETTT